jgi:hypothetical protein
MRELVRGWALPLLVLVFLVYLALHRSTPGAAIELSASLFLEHAFAGLMALLVLAALFFGVLGPRRDRAAGENAARRLAGDAAWTWGRALGLLAILLLLSFFGATLVWIHYAARFGDIEGEARPLRRHVVSQSFARGRPWRELRKLGERLEFEFIRPTGALENGSTPLVIRVAPRLAIARDGDPQRAHYPLRWRLSEPDGSFRRQGILRLRQGRAARIFTEYRGSERPERLVLALEKIDPEYRVRLRQRDVIVIAESRSFVAALLTGAAICALYAAIFGALAIFFARRLGVAGGLVIAGGAAILAASFEALSVGPLARLEPWPRQLVLDSLRFFLPDLDLLDVSAWFARGRAPTLSILFALFGRTLITVAALGFFAGLLDRGGKNS